MYRKDAIVMNCYSPSNCPYNTYVPKIIPMATEKIAHFSHLDSGINDGYIVWRSKPGIDNNLVTMSGGQKIDKSSFYSCNSPFNINNNNIDLLCANLSSLGISKQDIGTMVTGGLIDCQHEKTQLFYNGKPQILARYPNIDSSSGLYVYTTIIEALNEKDLRSPSTLKGYAVCIK